LLATAIARAGRALGLWVVASAAMACSAPADLATAPQPAASSAEPPAEAPEPATLPGTDGPQPVHPVNAERADAAARNGSDQGSGSHHFFNPPQLAFDLGLTGVGFELEEGLLMHAMVVRTSDDAAVAMMIRQVQGGLFRLQWSQVLQPAVQYRVELFASEEPFEDCHMPPHKAWRVSLPIASGNLDEYYQRSGQYSQEACDAFDNEIPEP
jgi:hypothetical protein